MAIIYSVQLEQEYESPTMLGYYNTFEFAMARVKEIIKDKTERMQKNHWLTIRSFELNKPIREDFAMNDIVDFEVSGEHILELRKKLKI